MRFQCFTSTGRVKPISRPMCKWQPRFLGTWGSVQQWEIHLNLIFCKDLIIHSYLPSSSILFKFCFRHGSTTAIQCAKFQKDWPMEIDAMDERLFASFRITGEFEMEFMQIFHIVTNLWHTHQLRLISLSKHDITVKFIWISPCLKYCFNP